VYYSFVVTITKQVMRRYEDAHIGSHDSDSDHRLMRRISKRRNVQLNLPITSYRATVGGADCCSEDQSHIPAPELIWDALT